MSFLVWTDRKLLAEFGQIAASLTRLEKKMADLSREIQDLKSTVADITGDVTSILDKLKNASNVTDDQVADLDQAISGLRTLHDTIQQTLQAKP